MNTTMKKDQFVFEKGGVTVFIPVNLEEFLGETFYSPEESRKVEAVIRQFFPNHFTKKVNFWSFLPK